MNLDSLAPRPCSECSQTKDLTILQGPDLEPICLDCLATKDPAQAAVLRAIQDRRQ